MAQQLAVGSVCFVGAPEAAVTWHWSALEKIQDASLDVFVILKWTDFISKSKEANSVVGL